MQSGPKQIKTPLELVRLIRKHRRAQRLARCLIVVEADPRSGWTAKSTAAPEVVDAVQAELDAIARELREIYALEQ